MTPEPVESWEEGKDIFIDPTDDSTTRIARPCKGCGHHQTIAGALLKSSYWREWYEHASKGMLYDVDETRWIDAMSDNHFTDFIDFVTASQKQKQIEEFVSMLEGMKEEYPPEVNLRTVPNLIPLMVRNKTLDHIINKLKGDTK